MIGQLGFLVSVLEFTKPTTRPKDTLFYNPFGTNHKLTSHLELALKLFGGPFLFFLKRKKKKLGNHIWQVVHDQIARIENTH